MQLHQIYGLAKEFSSLVSCNEVEKHLNVFYSFMIKDKTESDLKKSIKALKDQSKYFKKDQVEHFAYLFLSSCLACGASMHHFKKVQYYGKRINNLK